MYADTLVLRELAGKWAALNYTHFDNALAPPVIAWGTGTTRLGAWRRTGRTLEIARELVRDHAWSVVVEVLKHEMAHQYVDEVLRITDETAHGPAFREVCARMGIDPAASGLPQPPSADEDRVLRRIQRLLALADSPNQHEAEAAMSAAHRLMLKHNIDWAASTAERRYGFRQLGAPSGRIDAHEKVLAGLLASHFFVRAIWVPTFVAEDGRRGRVLELCGTTANLDIAEYVHTYLLETGERSWRAHKRARGISGDRERRRFLAGLITGFYEKLQAGTRECRNEGLVWVGDAALEDWVGRRHPYLRRSSARVVHSAAYHDGRAAGHDIVLRKPVTGAATNRGRALTGD